MIGNNEIDARSLRALRRRKSADAGIDADDQPNAGRGRTLDHITAQVVAFANAVRHVEVGSAAAKFNRCFQDDDRGSAVDVVVAVDENSLFALDRGLQTIDSGFHPGH